MDTKGIPPGWESAVARMRAELERKALENPQAVITLEQLSQSQDQDVCLSCVYGARMIGTLKCGNLKSKKYRQAVAAMDTCARFKRHGSRP